MHPTPWHLGSLLFILLLSACSRAGDATHLCLPSYDLSFPNFTEEQDPQSPRSLDFFFREVLPRVQHNTFRSPVLCLPAHSHAAFRGNNDKAVRGLFLTGDVRGIRGALVLGTTGTVPARYGEPAGYGEPARYGEPGYGVSEYAVSEYGLSPNEPSPYELLWRESEFGFSRVHPDLFQMALAERLEPVKHEDRNLLALAHELRRRGAARGTASLPDGHE